MTEWAFDFGMGMVLGALVGVSGFILVVAASVGAFNFIKSIPRTVWGTLLFLSLPATLYLGMWVWDIIPPDDVGWGGRSRNMHFPCLFGITLALIGQTIAGIVVLSSSGKQQ